MRLNLRVCLVPDPLDVGLVALGACDAVRLARHLRGDVREDRRERQDILLVALADLARLE